MARGLPSLAPSDSGALQGRDGTHIYTLVGRQTREGHVSGSFHSSVLLPAPCAPGSESPSPAPGTAGARLAFQRTGWPSPEALFNAAGPPGPKHRFPQSFSAQWFHVPYIPLQARASRAGVGQQRGPLESAGLQAPGSWARSPVASVPDTRIFGSARLNVYTPRFTHSSQDQPGRPSVHPFCHLRFTHWV